MPLVITDQQFEEALAVLHDGIASIFGREEEAPS
jgi:hypothetical protein